MVWWWTEGFFFWPDCCAICFRWWQDKPQILPVSLRLVGIPCFQTRSNVFLWGSTGCNKRVWHKSVRMMYNFSTVVYTLSTYSFISTGLPGWKHWYIAALFFNGKQRWPWNFHPLPPYLTRKIAISTWYEFVLRKTQVRSARGFNRWTRLPQTITFKCLPRGRIWSTATTRWGPTPVAGELSDLRLNAPFSQKMKECFLFQTLVPKKVRRLSSPTYLFEV